MTLDLFIIILPILVLMTFLTVLRIVNFMLNKKPKTNNNNNKIKKVKNGNSLYKIITQIPIGGRSISELKDTLYINKYETEEILRYRAITYYILSWLLSTLIFILITPI